MFTIFVLISECSSVFLSLFSLFFFSLNRLPLFIPPTLFSPFSVPLVPCGDVSPVTNKLM